MKKKKLRKQNELLQYICGVMDDFVRTVYREAGLKFPKKFDPYHEAERLIDHIKMKNTGIKF